MTEGLGASKVDKVPISHGVQDRSLRRRCPFGALVANSNLRRCIKGLPNPL
jgi:hypothetical protein